MMSDPVRLIGAARAAVDAQQAIIGEYRWQLAEARAHAILLARQLTARTEFADALARDLDEARIELVRKDDRIAELERELEAARDELVRYDERVVELGRQLEVAGWRERLGGL